MGITTASNHSSSDAAMQGGSGGCMKIGPDLAPDGHGRASIFVLQHLLMICRW
jgi:hypothetical protein